MYQAKENQYTRRDVLKGLLIGVTAASAGLELIALTSGNVHAQGNTQQSESQSNTKTYVPKTVQEVSDYNLSGYWKTIFPEGEVTVLITQNGNHFEGAPTSPFTESQRDQPRIRGRVKNGKVYCAVYNQFSGWRVESHVAIDKGGNSFECVGARVYTFTRVK